MPAPLKIPTERVSWRIATSDLDLLRAIYGEGRVTDAVRDLVAAYCAHARAKLEGNPDLRDCKTKKAS